MQAAGRSSDQSPVLTPVTQTSPQFRNLIQDAGQEIDPTLPTAAPSVDSNGATGGHGIEGGTFRDSHTENVWEAEGRALEGQTISKEDYILSEELGDTSPQTKGVGPTFFSDEGTAIELQVLSNDTAGNVTPAPSKGTDSPGRTLVPSKDVPAGKKEIKTPERR